MYTRHVYETIGDYDEELFLTEDFDYWQRIYGYFGAVYKKDIIYDYRLHPAALTGTRKEELYYQALCKTLTKNRKLFGKFSIKQNYFYYQTLSDGMKITGAPNPYAWKYRLYSILYFLNYTLPQKILKQKTDN